MRLVKAGVPLSVKLILTTSIVVSGAVFASAVYSQRAIRDLAHADAAARGVEGRAAIRREAELLARNVATAVSIPLGASQLSDVPPLLRSAVADYPRIQWLLVTDSTGQVVASTAGAPSTSADELATELASGAPGLVVHRGEGTQWTYGTMIRLGDQSLGQLRVGVTTAELEAALAASLAAADRRAEEARQKMTLIALVLLGIGVLVAALQGWGMARPIRQLAAQAERIAGGDLQQRVPENRADEIGVLARNFNFMAGRIGTLLVESAQKASLEREMSLARQVQQAMLPPDELVAHGGAKIVGHCVPASSCGGDWWTYRKMSENRTLIVIGDATGHGMHSALIAATARGAVEALADADERLVTPEQVLQSIHAAISGVGEHALLMTCFAAVVDPAGKQLAYANAGQNFPYVMRRGGDGVLDEAQIIAASGNPLGDRDVPQVLRRGTVSMQPGDVLVAFTDGVVERQNPVGKLFGDRRLRGVFKGARIDAADDLAKLRLDVVRAVDAFAEGTDSQDDVTFVLVLSEPALDKRVRSAS
jgi:serine phosphatase RsbU (regulator of sigma subunit)/HAMP domain-containing protein